MLLRVPQSPDELFDRRRLIAARRVRRHQLEVHRRTIVAIREQQNGKQCAAQDYVKVARSASDRL